jgi:hypothetical protein
VFLFCHPKKVKKVFRNRLTSEKNQADSPLVLFC